MSKKTFTREELFEKYDFLEEVDMSERPIKIKVGKGQEEVEETCYTHALVREYDGEDQVAVDKDKRCKNNKSMQSIMLSIRISYFKPEGSDEYVQFNLHEGKQIKGFNQRILSKAMLKVTGESEDFLDD